MNTTIYGPNSEVVKALIDKWEKLSEVDLVCLYYAQRHNLWIDPRGINDDPLERTSFLVDFLQEFIECDNNDDPRECVGWIQHLNDLQEEAFEEARGAASTSGRETAVWAAMGNILSALPDDVQNYILDPKYDDPEYEDSEGGASAVDFPILPRFCAGSAVMNASIAVLTWDLAHGDSAYTPEMRNLLYEPWNEIVNQAGFRTGLRQTGRFERWRGLR